MWWPWWPWARQRPEGRENGWPQAGTAEPRHVLKAAGKGRGCVTQPHSHARCSAARGSSPAMPPLPAKCHSLRPIAQPHAAAAAAAAAIPPHLQPTCCSP